MDNEEDDDGNFTKWMSSYWGHGDEISKERKRSFRRPSRNKADRRASLPSMSREEKEAHSHPRARRVSSDENSRTKVGGPECHITTIPELSECLEKRLRFHNQKAISMGDSDSICLICHEELRNGRGGIQELNCSHHFHEETVLTKWPEHRTRPRSGSSAPACERGKETPFCPGQEEYRLPRRQLSLRRQR
ncbi:leukemia NUP98 fusion partner 1 isoform X2 [Megalobrama amblycephala]|uniref:leukemia NUP98 fusion partner 1 isoform X2 n=1 Tax=Megalobrama amblycephala TaxID=75352 RepID=UPI0020141AFC|nr:leukemia NUP98 fusion partner 1 isoform X2 [Megalobrama amblycephala]